MNRNLLSNRNQMQYLESSVVFLNTTEDSRYYIRLKFWKTFIFEKNSDVFIRKVRKWICFQPVVRTFSILIDRSAAKAVERTSRWRMLRFFRFALFTKIETTWSRVDSIRRHPLRFCSRRHQSSFSRMRRHRIWTGNAACSLARWASAEQTQI